MNINLYKNIVHPILEYRNVVCSPHFVLDQQSLKQSTEELPSYSIEDGKGWAMILMYKIIYGFTGIVRSIFTFIDT